MPMTSPIKPADISFEDGTPYAAQFDDHYFSQDDGLAESQYVYLDGNQLTTRFQSLSEVFQIVETGFGTGLNFLLTWQLFDQVAQPSARLSFTSIECYPLRAPDLQRALASFPTIAPYAEQLIAQWPHHARGQHRLIFDRVELTLCFGDVEEVLPELVAKVDAWFLDGFAPARNPKMWQAYLYQHMARLSKPLATAASFTSANPVRRGLERWGFAVKHSPGFGRKRYMTQAKFEQDKGPQRPQMGKHYWSNPTTVADRSKRIAIIGAGIAGIQTAYALKRKGMQVQVFESSDHICAGASGNRQGALYIRPSLDTSALAQWQSSAYQFATHQLQQLALGEDDYQQCGVLQLPLSEKDQLRQQSIAKQHSLYPSTMVRWLSQQEASQIAGYELSSGGLFFRDGAWVHPQAWMQALDVNVALNRTLSSLERTTTGWQLTFNDSETHQFDHVVICSGWQANLWLPELEIKPIRGQVTACNQTLACQSVICAERYITPALSSGTQHFGATYDLGSTHSRTLDTDQFENIDQLAKRFGPREIVVTGNRASVRATTPDTLPFVGEVAASQFASWAQQQHKQRLACSELPPMQSGLFVNTGHGSRGLATAALAGEVVASIVCGQALPIDQATLAAIHPARRIFKQVIRG